MLSQDSTVDEEEDEEGVEESEEPVGVVPSGQVSYCGSVGTVSREGHEHCERGGWMKDANLPGCSN
jgi:hypothetical protein